MTGSAATPSAWWRPVLLFVLLYALLQAGVTALRGAPAGQALIDDITVRPAAVLLSLAAPHDGVQAAGPRLVWPGGSLGLRNGCDALEIIVLFAAAALVAPGALWARGALLLAGCALLWALNQGRVLALYAAFRHRREWFDGLHTVWLPLVLVAAAAALYLWALNRPRAG